MKNGVKYLSVAALAAAVFCATCEFGFDTRPDAAAEEFIPVEGITGVPAGGQPYVALPLAATVLPANATIKTIDWSIASDGGTGATLDGARLTADAEGTVTVIALIRNGWGDGADYAEIFSILISLTGVYAVEDIYGIPESLPIGDYTYTLNGKVTPQNASNKNIVWSVIDGGGTGAAVTPEGFLSAQRRGTVRLLATIADGRLTSDYTQEFSIVITRGVIAAGNYILSYLNNNIWKACYWVDGEFNDLASAYSFGSINGFISRTVGIVSTNGKHYIAGDYVSGRDQITVCYWVNGVEKTLPNSAGAYNQTNTTLFGSSPSTEAFSIAAGGGNVYILGRVNNTYCYWKIDANSDSAAGPVTLAMPIGFENDYIDAFNIPRMVVKNDGNVVIVGRLYYRVDYMTTRDDGVYYWLGAGNDTTINPAKIPALDDFIVNDVAVVNTDVYITGRSNSYLYPCYYIMGNSSYHVFDTTDNLSNDIYQSVSVIEQNGVPVFYGNFATTYSNNYAYRYWRIGGNVIDIPIVFSFNSPVGYTPLTTWRHLDILKSFFKDDDVYVVVTSNDKLASYIVLREPFPFRKVDPFTVSFDSPIFTGSYDSYSTEITGIVPLDDDMLPGSVRSIVANWQEGEAISLVAPAVNLYGGQTVTEQGWQISEDGNDSWTAFTPPSTADMSYDGKYLRYYARGSGGRTYYSNTAAIRVLSTSREVTIAMWASRYGNWGSLRISINGFSLPANVGDPTDSSYTFSVNKNSIVQIYYTRDINSVAGAFALYYSDDPPSPMFDPNTGTTGGKVLVSKTYSTIYPTNYDNLVGSFTVQ